MYENVAKSIAAVLLDSGRVLHDNAAQIVQQRLDHRRVALRAKLARKYFIFGVNILFLASIFALFFFFCFTYEKKIKMCVCLHSHRRCH